MVFHDSDKVVQMFICAENKAILDLPSFDILDGIAYMMAAYYVLDVQYPRVCKPSFLFFQDIIMDKTDNLPRPVRYSTFIKSLGF